MTSGKQLHLVILTKASLVLELLHHLSFFWANILLLCFICFLSISPPVSLIGGSGVFWIFFLEVSSSYFLFLSILCCDFSIKQNLCCDRSFSPRRRSPRRRSISPIARGRSYSRSPPYRHARRVSPYANGYDMVLM